jgi:hypothetical protein
MVDLGKDGDKKLLEKNNDRMLVIISDFQTLSGVLDHCKDHKFVELLPGCEKGYCTNATTRTEAKDRYVFSDYPGSII